MADLPRYWSEAFIEAFVEAVNDDMAFQKTARGFSETVIFRCLNTPDGTDIEASYTFENGEIVDVDLWEEPAPSADLRAAPIDPAAMARATAPYTLWVRLDKGEMSALQALTSPDYTIEGPKLKIMANMGVMSSLSHVSMRVPKTY